jgi:hypothetical protein
MTTAPASGSSSASTPQILRPSTSTSLGHLNPTAASGSTRAIVSAIDSPAAIGSQPNRSSGNGPSTVRGSMSTEIASALPAGATQLRSRRPRPAVWSPVTSVVNDSSRSARASAASSAFVDGDEARTSSRGTRAWDAGSCIRSA